MDATVDTAAAAHALLARLPQHKRHAALALLDLPVDWVVCPIGGPCVDYCDDPDGCDLEHPIVSHMTAGELLRELVQDIAGPELVFAVLNHRGLVRPGLGEVK